MRGKDQRSRSVALSKTRTRVVPKKHLSSKYQDINISNQFLKFGGLIFLAFSTAAWEKKGTKIFCKTMCFDVDVSLTFCRVSMKKLPLYTHTSCIQLKHVAPHHRQSQTTATPKASKSPRLRRLLLRAAQPLPPPPPTACARFAPGCHCRCRCRCGCAGCPLSADWKVGPPMMSAAGGAGGS